MAFVIIFKLAVVLVCVHVSVCVCKYVHVWCVSVCVLDEKCQNPAEVIARNVLCMPVLGKEIRS